MYEVRKFVRRTIPATETYFAAAFAPTFVSPTLLMHFDGPDGSTYFYDSSGHFILAGFTGTLPVTISNARSVFGGTSASFDGSGSRIEVTSDNSALAFGTNDFTIDVWVNHLNTGSQHNFIESNYISGDGNLTIYIDTLDQISFSVNAVQLIIGPVLTVDTWYHVALTRHGIETKLFLNGTQVGQTYIDSFNYGVGAGGYIIGAGALGALPLQGWMDEFRIINGYAAWTGGFQPPTAPYKPPG